jgi:cytochrome c
MILPETPDFFQIACDTQTKIAELHWDRYTGSETFRDNYRKLVQFMKSNNLNCALINVRERGEVPYSDQTWLCQEVFPELITQTRKTVKLAYVINEIHFYALQSESPSGQMETYGDLLKLQFFLDEASARRWLQAI